MPKTIGVLTTHIGGALRPYEKEFSQAAAETAKALGIDLVFYSGGFFEMQTGFERRRNFVYDFVKADKPDGLLVLSSLLGDFVDSETMHRLFDRYRTIPAVSAGMKIAGVSSIIVDNTAGMEAVARHLTEKHACRNPIFLAGPENNTEAQVRLSSATRILEQTGGQLDPSRIFFGDWYKTSGEKAARQIMDDRIPFDAVISSNDEMAFGFMEYMSSRGKTCPGDYLLTGFDDIPEATSFNPPLTTVKQHPALLGTTGIELVARLINGEQIPEETLIKTELHIRGSCGCNASPEYVEDTKAANNSLLELHRDYHRQERLEAALSTVSEGLINTTSMDQLCNVLHHDLGRIPAVLTCTMFLFEQNGTSENGLSPVITWERGKGAIHTEKPRKQYTTQPDNSSNSHIRIIEALNFADKTFGLLVFELDSIIFSVCGNLREQISVTLNNIHSFKRIASLNRDLAHKIDRLTALRTIDTAITNRSSFTALINVLLEQIVEQQHITAASITLFKPDTGDQTFFASTGLWEPLPVTTGHVHENPINAPDISQARHIPREIKIPESGAYFARPLLIQGKHAGLLELYNRTPITVTDDWYSFLDALTGQTLIALENITLFENLNTANGELRSAYNTTIEGWSRALDLRDHETEGHCIRVARQSVLLGKHLGLNEDELEALYRGALLHDIGKVAIPDAILLKPGPLTESEWITMRKHPQYAYELLSPIEFLSPSITVPWGHHEKWNGTGYPQGQKEKSIPFFARIFSVIDVWDALSSDRPYRKAWPQSKVLEYIASRAGTDFDPDVVAAFLEMDFNTNLI